MQARLHVPGEGRFWADSFVLIFTSSQFQAGVLFCVIRRPLVSCKHACMLWCQLVPVEVVELAVSQLLRSALAG